MIDHSDRYQYIGASEVAAVMGLDPYAGPWTVAARKRRILPETPDNAAMARGRRNEPHILAWATEDLGLTDAPFEDQPQIIHEQFPKMRATLDRMHRGYRNVIIEAKDTQNFEKIPAIKRSIAMNFPDPEVLPWWIQIQAQMACAASKFGYDGVLGYVAVWGPRDSRILWPVPFSHDHAHQITSHAQRFWDVHCGPDSSWPEPTAADLGSLELAPGTVPPVDCPDLEDVIREHRELGKQIGAAEKARDAAKARILIRLREMDAKGIAAGTERVTVVTSDRTSIDTRALESAHPDIAAAFARKTTVATLRHAAHKGE